MPLNLPAVLAESVTLLVARETTLGTQPTSGWQTLQPNEGGIDGFYAHIGVKQPSPLSKFRQMEASQIVDLDATPKIVHDLTKDMFDAFGEGLMLSRAKHAGGTGQAYFTNQLATPQITARTTTAYTVSANGALQAGTLVVPRGWITGANAAANGTLQVVGASSTGTSVPVAAGVAETPAGAYAVTLEVAGFRGTAGDIGIDVNGNITSTTADFTTMGLVPNMVIWVGGTIGSAFTFANAAYRGFAKIATVAAHLITFARRAWTVAAADTGATKTIDLYWGRYLRNVAFGDADFLLSSYQMELTYPGLSGGTVDEYAYSAGNIVNMMEIDASPQSLVTSTITFLGTTIGDPTTVRATGAATAGGLLAIDRYNTVTRELYRRILLQSDESIICDDIESFKLMIMNHVTAQKQQGTLGSARPIVGKIETSVDVTGVLTQDNAMKACTGNLTVMAGFGFRNTDGGIFFDIPSAKITDAPPAFPANGAVTLALKLSAFRDAASNVTTGISTFPFLPVA